MIARNGLETNNNLMVLSRLFPLLVGEERAPRPMILWLPEPAIFADFWRLDRVVSNSENRVLLCASKRSRKHGGFWRFLHCLPLQLCLSPRGYRCSFFCCFCALLLFSEIRNGWCRQIQISSSPRLMEP